MNTPATLRHPSSSGHLSLPPAGTTSKTLILDHFLQLHAASRFRSARKRLGMTLPGRGYESEEEPTEVLGYGRSRKIRLEKMTAASLSPSPSPPSRRQSQTRGGGASDALVDEQEADRIERMLSALLDSLRVSPAAGDDSDSSSNSDGMDTDDDDDNETMHQASSAAESLPEGTRHRLVLAGMLDLVLTDDMPLNAASVPAKSFSRETLVGLDNLLGLISSAPLPEHLLQRQQACDASLSLSAAAVTSSTSSSPPPPVVPEAALSTSPPPPSASIYPPGTIWASVPRAAGPESPWAFAGSRSRASVSSSSGTAAADEGGDAASGPRTRKAVGRSKELFDKGVVLPAVSSSTSGENGARPNTSVPSSSCYSNRSRRLYEASVLSGAFANPSSTASSTASMSASNHPAAPPPNSRLLLFLRTFLLLSRDVAYAIGKKAIDDANKAAAASAAARRPRRVAPPPAPGSRGGFGGLMSLAVIRDEDDEEDDRWESDSEASIRGSNESSPSPEPCDEEASPAPSSASGGYDDGSSPQPLPPNRQLFSRHRLARPTRAWFALLATLLTQVCLEGFLHEGWQGGEIVELVMGVGRGGSGEKDGGDKELAQAGWMLFGEHHPPGSGKSGKRGTRRWRQFDQEMEDRCSELLTIPLQTASLSSHLSSLAAKHPREPFARAALRFLEAVAVHLGAPSLSKLHPLTPPSTLSASASPGQQYSPSYSASTSVASTISIASLLNPSSDLSPEQSRRFPTYQQEPPIPPPNPIPPRKGIDRYFVPPRRKHVPGASGAGSSGVTRGSSSSSSLWRTHHHTGSAPQQSPSSASSAPQPIGWSYYSRRPLAFTQVPPPIPPPPQPVCSDSTTTVRAGLKRSRSETIHPGGKRRSSRAHETEDENDKEEELTNRGNWTGKDAMAGVMVMPVDPMAVVDSDWPDPFGV